MEMQQVRYFLAVAKTLNFTRAAEACNVTQPALTRAIKQLEDELGGELIRREGRLSHLTDLGTRMLPLLTQCYESALNAKALAAKVRSGDVATLAVGVSLTLDVSLLLAALAELQRAFPGLQLMIRRGSGADVAEWLKSGEIELAFGGPLGESWDRLDCWPMFTEAFDLVVAQDHELAKVNDMDLQVELIGKERLLLHAFQDGSEITPASLEAAGIRVEDAHQVNCNQDLETLVQAKFGVAVLPASTLRTAGLMHLPCPGLDLRRTVAIYSIAGRARSREAGALLNLVRAADWNSAASA
jgi:DNA-binding transcriptional LysR family regulator